MKKLVTTVLLAIIAASNAALASDTFVPMYCGRNTRFKIFEPVKIETVCVGYDSDVREHSNWVRIQYTLSNGDTRIDIPRKND
ncbi:MAG TPA: hypothetical protein VIG33_04335, partial [Pseudobdellovibrionaceae bacterium]